MKIKITAQNIELNEPLKNYIYDKLGSLDKFEENLMKDNYYGKLKRFLGRGKPKVEMWVEIEKITGEGPPSKGEIFRAEAQMRFPGESIRAEATNEDIRQAITEVKDELQGQIKKYKGKRRTMYKKVARKFKKMLHMAKGARRGDEEEEPEEEL